MGSSLMMNTLNSTRDMPLNEREIDELHRIVTYRGEEEQDAAGRGNIAPTSAASHGAASSAVAAGKRSHAASAATMSSTNTVAGNGGGGGVGGVVTADDGQPAVEEISLAEMFSWSAVNLWGVWMLTCVLTMWTLREYLPIRESLNQYIAAMQVVTVQDEIVFFSVMAICFFALMCFDIYCQRIYDISFFVYIRSGDFLSLKLPAKRETTNVLSDYKVWRNPLCLFRGAEYDRYTWSTNGHPLTDWDRELTAQDHSVMFVCNSDADQPNSASGIMADAWRSSCSAERVQLAHKALDREPGHPAALLMLAEEEATTILETEGLLRQALKSLEVSGRPINPGPVVIVGSTQTMASRNKTLLIYIKWRLGMCARKLGHLKEAVRLFRQITRDCPYLSAHENLIEALLEMKSYADVQQVLSKYDDLGLPKSASICYTSVLLKTRTSSDTPLTPVEAMRVNATNAELEMLASISRAVEFNPHVAQYLLEQKSFLLPPEHVVKRGDSEAVAYAFHHLRHWKQVEGALTFLQYSWDSGPCISHLSHPTQQGRYFHPYPSSTRDGDCQILPRRHTVSPHPFERTPSSTVFSFIGCMVCVGMALFMQTFPNVTAMLRSLFIFWLHVPLVYSSQMMEHYCPTVWLTLSEG